MKRCTVPGCDRKHKARGYCPSHYTQAINSGAITTTPRAPADRLLPIGGLAFSPSRPARITNALHALAESRPTPSEYERAKAQILAREE